VVSGEEEALRVSHSIHTLACAATRMARVRLVLLGTSPRRENCSAALSLIPSEEVHTVLPRFTCSLVFGAVLLVACGGSGSDTSNPTAACNALATSYCNKAQSCGVNVASTCASNAQNVMDCAHVACPAGTTFDSGAASQCIDAINAWSCNEDASAIVNGTLPDACHAVCH